jgi:hypothetical protein
MSPIDKHLAIGVTIAAVVIFAASFMPWGTIRVRVGRGPATLDLPFKLDGTHPLPDEVASVEFGVRVTGWNGNMLLGSLELPNWLVVVAAIGVATLCWLNVTSVWAAPPALLFGLAGYGLFYAGDVLVWLLTSDKRCAGVGSFLTVIGFAGILVALVRHARAAKPAAAPDVV